MLHLKLVDENQNYTRTQARQAMNLSEESFSTYFAQYMPMQAQLVQVGKKRVIYPGKALNQRIHQLARNKIAIVDENEQDETKRNTEPNLPLFNIEAYTLTNFVTYDLNPEKQTFDNYTNQYCKIVDQLPNEQVLFNPLITLNGYSAINASYITPNWQKVEDPELVRQMFTQAGTLVGYYVKQLFINTKEKKLIAFTVPYLAKDTIDYANNNKQIVNNFDPSAKMLNSMVKSALCVINPTSKALNNQPIKHFPSDELIKTYNNLIPRAYGYAYINAVIAYLGVKQFDLAKLNAEQDNGKADFLSDVRSIFDYAKSQGNCFYQPRFYQGDLTIDYSLMNTAQKISTALFDWNQMWERPSEISNLHRLAQRDLHSDKNINDDWLNAILAYVSELCGLENLSMEYKFNHAEMLEMLPDLNDNFDKIIKNSLMYNTEQKQVQKCLQNQQYVTKFKHDLNKLLVKYNIDGQLTNGEEKQLSTLLLPMQMRPDCKYDKLAENGLLFCALGQVIKANLKKDNKLAQQYQKHVPEIIKDYLKNINLEIWLNKN